MLKGIIGNKNIFAVEYEITQFYDKCMYGKFCYWIQGIQIGRYDEGTILSDMLWTIPNLVRDNGNREHIIFFDLELEEVFYRLSGKAFLDGNSEYEHNANEEVWARFDICIHVDITEDNYIFLIDNNEDARLIFSLPDKPIQQLYLNSGTVDKVLRRLYDEFNNIYDKYIEEKSDMN